LQVNAFLFLIHCQGMAPTLIIVRVQLGVSINSVDETINTIQKNSLGSQTRIAEWSSIDRSVVEEKF